MPFEFKEIQTLSVVDEHEIATKGDTDRLGHAYTKLKTEAAEELHRLRTEIRRLEDQQCCPYSGASCAATIQGTSRWR